MYISSIRQCIKHSFISLEVFGGFVFSLLYIIYQVCFIWKFLAIYYSVVS